VLRSRRQERQCRRSRIAFAGEGFTLSERSSLIHQSHTSTVTLFQMPLSSQLMSNHTRSLGAAAAAAATGRRRGGKRKKSIRSEIQRIRLGSESRGGGSCDDRERRFAQNFYFAG
jgi:hypothetical protein